MSEKQNKSTQTDWKPEYGRKYRASIPKRPLCDVDPLTEEERRKIILSRLSKAEDILPSLRERTEQAFRKKGWRYRPAGGW